LGVALFLGALVLNLLITYGGVRPVDSEVVFELCESLATRGALDVEGTPVWKGFGIAPGKDGRLYPIFGPGESFACVPMLVLLRGLNRTGWYESGLLPPLHPSHYLPEAHERFTAGLPPLDLVPHAERLALPLLNVLVGALGVLVFWRIASRLSRHPAAALGVTVLYGLGTLAWPYAGDAFSEPLATLLCLVAFELLLRVDASPPATLLWAGLALGGAIATHVTAVLFVPFFAALALRGAEHRWRKGAFLLAGLGVMLLALGSYNFVRFGSPWETGRHVDPELVLRYGYGQSVAPWEGLFGLTLSAGKGLFLYSPAVLLGLFAWPTFHREHRFLSSMLAGAALLRLVFIATRSDWHGGFSLGPRMLVMLIPFLLIPVVPWLDHKLAEGSGRALRLFAGFSVLCIAQQVAFCVGEVFSYYHLVREFYAAQGINIFEENRIYLDWEVSPLQFLLEGNRGPWLLSTLPVDNYTLWGLMTALLAALYFIGARRVVRLSHGASVPPGVNG
jgi:hypothetical protein